MQQSTGGRIAMLFLHGSSRTSFVGIQFFENTNSLCVGENIDETNTEEVYDRFIHTITSS